MLATFSTIFGIHETSIALRAQRAEVLADNLANVDTPNYKARDVDFASVLRGMKASTDHRSLKATHIRHFASSDSASSAHGELQYRVPMQPSLDGNTVDSELEQARFMENALRYQASLTFLDGRIKGLLSALREE